MIVRLAIRSSAYLLILLLAMGFLHASSMGVEDTLSLSISESASSGGSAEDVVTSVPGDSIQQQITADDKYALVIGIVYDNYELGSINFANRDAVAVYDYLTGQLGFSRDHVRLLLDGGASRANILQSLEWLSESTAQSPNPEVVFFFSGHGLRTGPGFGLNIPGMSTAFSLVPHDFMNFDYQKGDGLIWDKELAEYLSQITPAKMWISIDSCFSGGFNRPGISGPNRVLTLSSQWDELSSEINDAGRSVMTQYMFEEGMKQGLSIEASFARLSPRAPLEYGQNPVIYDGYLGDLRL